MVVKTTIIYDNEKQLYRPFVLEIIKGKYYIDNKEVTAKEFNNMVKQA